MNNLNPTPTSYAQLGIHPSAPWELVDAAYWWAAIALQDQRAADHAAAAALYRLTRAFETVADARRRADYDEAIGYQDESLVSRQLFKSRQSVFSRIFRRRPATLPPIDYYELVGLDESAPARWIPEARRIMRNHYLNVADAQRRALLLSLLDEACGVLSDVATRAQYDELREARLLMQRPAADPDTIGATPADNKTMAGLDEPSPRAEATSPESIGEPPDEPPNNATRIAPHVKRRQTKRPAPIAAGDDLSQKQPSTERAVNLEQGSASESGLPHSQALLPLVVRRAKAGTTRLGRALAVIGRAAGALTRGAASSVVALPRSRLRKRASVLPAYPAWEPRAGNFPAIQQAVAEVSGAWLELPGGEKHALGKAPVTIGRTSDCAIGLPSGPDGGDERARIWCRDGRYMLHNLSPLADVVVAGKPAAWVILEDGDDIVLGQQKIVFRDPQAGGG